MPKIIKGREVIEDQWVLVAEPSEELQTIEDDIHIIVPLSYWTDNKTAILARTGKAGIQVSGADELDSFSEDLDDIDVIAIDFPKFGDGRGYSMARLLRERHGYTSEIRATGDVLRDQLSFMERCGFDAYALRADRNMEDAIKSFSALTIAYQSDVVEPRPIYARRP
ncbi:hypothetical protein A9Q99_26585 [Gammaproteobacteria bacterium 45_16_T64]|nr:hypothetical protein A9Q99_26585 [Gammaproteobacteria bacterium 45_16_T64]